MIMVNKYNLILIAIMDKDFGKDDIRQEAEKALDQFYILYEKEMNGDECTDVHQFESFKRLLYDQIENYFSRIQEEEQGEIGDFGFFTEAITKLRNNGGNNH
jgi:hypothetical protein